MANARVEGFEQLEKFLGKLAEPIKMAIKAVDSAAPILEESLRSEISGAANRGYVTGELAASISATKAKENQYGVYSVVKPVGTDSGGTRNAEKLAYLEYGTSRGQKPHPVRQKAINAAEAKCADIIEKEIADAVEKLW